MAHFCLHSRPWPLHSDSMTPIWMVLSQFITSNSYKWCSDWKSDLNRPLNSKQTHYKPFHRIITINFSFLQEENEYIQTRGQTISPFWYRTVAKCKSNLRTDFKIQHIIASVNANVFYITYSTPNKRILSFRVQS